MSLPNFSNFKQSDLQWVVDILKWMNVLDFVTQYPHLCRQIFEIYEDVETECNYLSLTELGRILETLSKMPQLQGELTTNSPIYVSR